MKLSLRMVTQRPWRNGLIVTTALSLFLFSASWLWSAGMAEWAFVLAFIATWSLISISWSNDEHIEGSNQILAGIVDHNFDRMHNRLKKLERELEELADHPQTSVRKVA
jgi:hypothetical protein